MATYAERLVKIQDAIDALIAGAQEVEITIGTSSVRRRYRKVDLQVLWTMEKNYKILADREANSGIKIFGGTPV